MSKREFCTLLLTCADSEQATEITNVLLEKRLIVCAKQLPVNSHFLWKGEIENNKEVMLLMDSSFDLFNQIEKEVAKLHSYETFVLQAVPVTQVSSSASKWMSQELKDE